MQSDSMEALAYSVIAAAPFIILFLVVLGILWFLLPFAVFGVKKRLDATILLLTQVREELRVLNGAEPNAAPEPPSLGTPPPPPTPPTA